MTGIDRRLFVFGLCGVGLTGMPLARINSVFAATKISLNERSVLIVVDVQNCFLPSGSLAVKEGEQVVPIIKSDRQGLYERRADTRLAYAPACLVCFGASGDEAVRND